MELESFTMLAAAYQVLPLQAASVERLFSSTNYIENELRTRMTAEHLEISVRAFSRKEGYKDRDYSTLALKPSLRRIANQKTKAERAAARKLRKKEKKAKKQRAAEQEAAAATSERRKERKKKKDRELIKRKRAGSAGSVDEERPKKGHRKHRN